MQTIELLLDANLYNGMGVKVGDENQWLFVDGSTKKFDDLSPAEVATLITKMDSNCFDAENRIVYLIQQHNIPIGTQNIEDYLTDEEEIIYKKDKKIVTECDEFRVPLLELWNTKFDKEYIVRGPSGK